MVLSVWLHEYVERAVLPTLHPKLQILGWGCKGLTLLHHPAARALAYRWE